MPIGSNPFVGYTNGGMTGPLGRIYDPGNLTTKGGLRNGIGNQYGQNSLLEAQQQAQRGSEFGTLMPGYQSLLNSGYSDQQKSGIQQGTLGAIQGSYGSANDAAARRLARTNNAAGYGSFLGASARAKGQDLAQQELNNQKSFADEALRRKMMGLQGIAQLYGVDTSFLNSLGQQQLGALGLGNSVQSRSRGVLNTIGEVGSIIGL